MDTSKNVKGHIGSSGLSLNEASAHKNCIDENELYNLSNDNEQLSVSTNIVSQRKYDSNSSNVLVSIIQIERLNGKT